MQKTTQVIASALLCFSLVLSRPVQAALDIASTPLSLTAGVAPNILLAVDDSGSMDSELLMPTNDGALWWHSGDQSFVGRNSQDALEAGVLNVNKGGGANGSWKKYVYLFPNGVDASQGRRVYGDSDNPHYAVPPLPQFAYARSPDFNKAYFNPDDIYLPWPTVGDSQFAATERDIAPSDPARGSATFDLTQHVYSEEANYTFKVFPGMPHPDGGTYDSEADLGFDYFPATFYLQSPLGGAHGYSAAPLTGFAPDSTELYGYEIKPANFQSTAHYETMMQNFANWFSYYRKRHLATRAGVAHSFFDVRHARVAAFTINDRASLAMKTLSVADQRAGFFRDIYAMGGNSGGTPNLLALRHAGNQLLRRDTGAPITAACQANNAILFTDGYSNYPGAGELADIGNEDAGEGPPYEDAVSDTLADIAMKFYKTNLREDLDPGQVPVNKACNLSSPPPALDCNNDPQMLTYAVTLGTRGLLFDPDNPVDPYSAPPPWHGSFENRSPKAVDDVWHATINGRGELFSASRPIEIAEKLKSAVSDILESVGSAAAVAANSTRLEADSVVYQARYDSRDWSGQLLAYEVAGDGTLSSLLWNTHEAGKIPTHDSRNIYTWAVTAEVAAAVPFAWSNLSTAQQAALSTGVAASEVATVGPRRVNWLRGDQSREGADTSFRIRTRLLGDIVNSTPAYHWRQNFGFAALPGAEGTSYAAHVAGKASEPAMLYVGANDGMLHGFKASDGTEQFAYIPAGVYPELYRLTQPDYVHRYFVDASPRVLDAYLDGAWASVLVGATGAGGRSVFAIDVSDPDALAARDILWDFSTGPDDAHKLGVAMSEPVIARLASGDWVAIFGNGYNSGDSVKLFLVDLEDGSLLGAINTGVDGADNGLGKVVPVDVDADRITDFVYAGDLTGNVWKFDLTGDSTGSWTVAYHSGGEPAPLFTARDANGLAQPVTGRIAAGPHPEGGVMVYFGTGKYFESGDAVVGESPPVQTFYGIHDSGAPVGGRGSLQAQTISAPDSRVLAGSDNTAEFDLRVVSNTDVDYSSKRGWYLDLKTAGSSHGDGERVVDQAILRYDRVIFTTLIPSADPCHFGGTSWLMELDALSGGRLDYSVFDANGDGLITQADMLDAEGSLVPPSGKKFDQLVSPPGIIDAGAKEFKYTSGSRGDIGITTERGAGYDSGRQAWWQLR